MVILSQIVVICIFLLILYLFKELRKQASEFSSRVRWWMEANATFTNHDSGRSLKKSSSKNNYLKKKNIYLSNWVEVASKIEHEITTKIGILF